MRCVITDYMGDDTKWETSELAGAGIDTFTAATKSTEDWLPQATDAHAIITRHALITREEIKQLVNCRVIARYGVGFDNIDVRAAQEAGITVTNVPGFCTTEVAEHVIGLILAIERGITRFAFLIRSGGWQPDPLPEIRPVAGLRIGLLGAGRIGLEVADRAAALRMEVYAYDPYVTLPEPIISLPTVEDLVSSVDVLSLHVPLTNETRRIIDAPMLARMRPGSTLINCARGGLCDESALLMALDSGRLRGIGLDTFESEPLRSDSPLRDDHRVICTPHVGYMSDRSLTEAKHGCVQEVVRALSGFAPLNPVLV